MVHSFGFSPFPSPAKHTGNFLPGGICFISITKEDGSRAIVEHQRAERPEKAERVAKAERPERPERPEKPEKPERPEKPEKPEKPGRPG